MAKILIIEDEKVLNEMYTMKFEMSWYEVIEAFDWQEWLDLAKAHKPDVILLDIMMPWLNWHETLEILKKESDWPVKILMFSNLSDKQNIDEALKKWADWYILKADTTPKQAVEKVNEVLNK